MDRNTCFLYHFTMQPYCNPNIRILIIHRKVLRKWHNDDTTVSFWRLYWNSKPGATIRYRQQTIELTPDRLVLVPPDTCISQRLIYGAPTHFYMHFFTDAPFDKLSPHVYTFKIEPHMLKKIKSAPMEEDDALIVNNLSLSLVMRGLIHDLLAQIPLVNLQSFHLTEHLINNMTFIETHTRHTLANREIARHLGTSVNTMLRVYKRELGLSPQAYLRQKRIEIACALLLDPQRSIKQVSEETGFCDQYHFSRTFKKLQKITPRRYRLLFK